MSFNPAYLTLTSTPVNPNITDFPVPVVPAAPLPQQWSYYSGSDTIATVEANGYFKYFAGFQNTLSYNDGNFFQVGDLIYCVCADGNTTLAVTQVGSSIHTSALAWPAGAIVTADLADGCVTTAKLGANAVTAAKIANATITTTQISASAGILGSQLSASAAITGSQLAAGANIAGSQLASNAGITGSQLANNTVATAQLDLSTIQYVKVPMTAAQWNGMSASPFALIAAPGANKIIVVQKLIGAMTFVSAQYAAGGAIICQYDSSATGAGVNACGTSTIAAATVNGFAASTSWGLTGQIPAAGAAFSTTVNKGLYLSNQTGAFTTGDGTWNIHIWYQVVTL